MKVMLTVQLLCSFDTSAHALTSIDKFNELETKVQLKTVNSVGENFRDQFKAQNRDHMVLCAEVTGLRRLCRWAH